MKRSEGVGMAKRRQTTRSIRIMVVDDHPVVREGIRQAIEREKGMVVCWEMASVVEALGCVVKTPPDLAIIDISLEDGNGIELVKDIRARRLRFPILVLSVHENVTYSERALRAGAQGYLTKAEAPEVIIDGIRQVLSGEIFVSKKIAPGLLSRVYVSKRKRGSGSVADLSDRELAVFEALGKGTGTRKIAKKLGISVSTVETYRANIKRKLDLSGGAELSSAATEWVISEGKK